jgi:hypothetical protein
LEKVMKFKPGESLTVLREVRYLGKLYRKTAKGFAVKHSKGYYEEIIKEIGLEGCKPRSSPNTTDMKPTTAEAKQRWEMGLNDADHALFRRSVGKLRFVIPERPDLGFEVMKPSKALARPVLHDMAALRRVVRYMDMELFLEPELRDKHLLEVWVDTDYAGDKVTRRSVGSTVARLDGVLLHFHSKQQTVVATSSAEAEYYGIAAGLAEGMAVRQILSEFNHKLDLWFAVTAAVAGPWL